MTTPTMTADLGSGGEAETIDQMDPMLRRLLQSLIDYERSAYRGNLSYEQREELRQEHARIAWEVDARLAEREDAVSINRSDAAMIQEMIEYALKAVYSVPPPEWVSAGNLLAAKLAALDKS